MSASPRPWTVDEHDYQHAFVLGVDGKTVADVYDPVNAELIVQAVNAFDAMVAALKQARAVLVHDGFVPIGPGGCIDEIDAALAKAGGG